MRPLILTLILSLPAAGSWANAPLTELETRWLNAADPVLTYAEKLSLPIDIIVQPKARAGESPLAMGYDGGRCKLVFSFRGNPDAESLLRNVKPADVDTAIEAMIAHEIAHCWRHTRGSWHSSPAAFAKPNTNVRTSVEKSKMQETRREEGFADLAALAWIREHHPDRYKQIYAWLQQVRGPQTEAGSHHDTHAWINLAADGSAFDDVGSTPFDRAYPLWVKGLNSKF